MSVSLPDSNGYEVSFIADSTENYLYEYVFYIVSGDNNLVIVILNGWDGTVNGYNVYQNGIPQYGTYQCFGSNMDSGSETCGGSPKIPSGTVIRVLVVNQKTIAITAGNDTIGTIHWDVSSATAFVISPTVDYEDLTVVDNTPPEEEESDDEEEEEEEEMKLWWIFIIIGVVIFLLIIMVVIFFLLKK